MKHNNNSETNGARIINSLQSGNVHGQIEVDGDNNSSSSNRNLVVVNPQQNNVVSKLELIDQNQQLIQLNNAPLTFSMEATKSNAQLEGCEWTFTVTTFCLISSIVGLLQNTILMLESNTILERGCFASFKSTNQWANMFLDFDEGSLGTWRFNDQEESCAIFYIDRRNRQVVSYAWDLIGHSIRGES